MGGGHTQKRYEARLMMEYIGTMKRMRIMSVQNSKTLQKEQERFYIVALVSGSNVRARWSKKPDSHISVPLQVLVHKPKRGDGGHRSEETRHYPTDLR
jgi:hypothetical protein